MKKTVFTAGGLLALGVLCYAGRLWAQPQTAPAGQAAKAAPSTRIALLNLTYVIKNYEKYKNFQEEMKGIIEPLQKRDAELRKSLEELTKQGAGASADKRAEIERQLKDIQRKIEDNNAEAKMKLGKKSDEQMKILYMDVVSAAQGYATSHDFDLVLHYNDATTEPEYWSVQNIARKLQSGALMPLYAASGMDISKEVVTLLNYNLRPAGTQQGAAGTPSAAPASGGQH